MMTGKITEYPLAVRIVESDEALTVLCAMDIITQNPKIQIKNLGNALAEADCLFEVKKDFLTMSYSNIEHYYYCAKMFIRLRTALSEKVTGYEVWNEENYKKLTATGIMLCDVAYEILRIRKDQEFLFVLKKAADYLPSEPYPNNIKGIMKGYLTRELKKMDFSEFEPARSGNHNAIRDRIGVNYLKELGCEFVTTEATLEKSDASTAKKGLRLDVYGWKNDSSIVGVEVKTRMSDFENALMEGRYERYLDYCSEFYILTSSRSVFNTAKRWCARHKDTGVLFYNRNKPDELEKYPPRSLCKRANSKMIKKAQEVFIAKMKKSVCETFLFDPICTPSAAMDQLLQNLSMEMKL